jgi:hypothetical protein
VTQQLKYKEMVENRELQKHNFSQRTAQERQTQRRTVKRNPRLPHVQLACTLEEVIMRLQLAAPFPSSHCYSHPPATHTQQIIEIYKRKDSEAFRNPVSKDVANYYQKIRRPISLSDIREKIGETCGQDVMCHLCLLSA